MNMEELISVIVPVYNVEKYLDKCLNSIVNQTYKNIEIIVIDDGSTDECGIKCDEWQRRDNRIKVIHQENKGLSETRNTGIKNATGKYISFVDSDDYVDSQFIEKLYNTLRKTNSDISVCNYVHIKENKNVILTVTGNIKEYSNTEAIIEFLNENDIYNYLWNKLFKKDLFIEISFPEERVFEDIRTTYKLIAKSKKVSKIQDELYVYINRSTSIVQTQTTNRLVELIKSINVRYYDIEKLYPNLNDINNMNRLKFIYRYFVKATNINWSVCNKNEMLEEYNFYRENYKKVKNIITQYNILYDVLFYSKKLFYIIIKIKNKFEKEN